MLTKWVFLYCHFWLTHGETPYDTSNSLTHPSQFFQPRFCYFLGPISKQLHFCFCSSSIVPSTLRQMQWLTIVMRFLPPRKCLCTIVSDSFHNWVHLLFPPPLSCRVKRFWNTVRERNAILHRCLVSCRALIFKLLYAAAFISPGKWQSVDALRAWLGFFFSLIISN